MNNLALFLHDKSADWRWRLAISFLLLAVVLFPVLSGLRVWRGDAIELFIPQLAFYKQVFSGGGSAFWNPFLGVGFPNFVSTMNPLAPPALLSALFSPISVHYWVLYIMLALMLFWAVSFLREIGIGIWSAWIGGFSYLLAGLWYDQNIIIGMAIFSQAALFWAIIKIFKSVSAKSSVPYAILGGLVVGWGWLSIGYWYNVYFFLTIAAFIFFLRKSWGAAMPRMILGFLAIWIIGTFIGLLQIVPAYVIMQFSGRSAGFEAVSAAGYTVGWKELFNFFHLTPNRGLDAYLYMGIVPLIFFIFSFWVKNRFATFFRCVFFIGLLIAFRGLPFFDLIHRLPVFNYFQGAARFLILSNFAAAALVGFGAEKLMTFIREGKIRIASRLFGYIALALAGLLILTVIVLTDRRVFYAAVISAIFLLLAYLAWKKFSMNQLLLPVLCLLTAVDFVITFYLFTAPFSIPRSSYERQPATAKFLKSVPPGRIFPLFPDDWDDQYFYYYFKKSAPSWEEAPYAFDLLFQTYFPNLVLLNQIESIETNDPLLNVNMGRLMALMGTRQLVTTGGEEKLNKLYKVNRELYEKPVEVSGQLVSGYDKDISAVERVKIFNERLPLADFLGVAYVIAPYRLDEHYPHFKLINYGATMKLSDEPGALPMPLFVFFNPTAKPLVYFTKVTDFKSDSSDIYHSFKEGGFKDIIVECGNCEKKQFSAVGEIKLISRTNGKIKLVTNSPEEQFLVFTQNHLPGWKALIDNEEVPIYKVNTVFPGIFVPAGAHHVIFRYDYWSLFDPALIFSRND